MLHKYGLCLISSVSISKLGWDLQNRATPLDSTKWQEMLKSAIGSATEAQVAQLQEQNTEPPLIMDIRNGYEWDGGHFAGATRPLEVY